MSKWHLFLPYSFSIEEPVEIRQEWRRRSKVSPAITVIFHPLLNFPARGTDFFSMKRQSTIEASPAAFQLNFFPNLQKFA
jgi:hypothetical protein